MTGGCYSPAEHPTPILSVRTFCAANPTKINVRKVKTMSALSKLQIAVAALCVALLWGCGERPLKDGTTGVLRYHEQQPGHIRVTVNHLEKNVVKAIGYGVTADDGTFRLVTNSGRAALKLAPGEYCCTLKSIGAQVRIPNEYAQVNTTPLRVTWSGNENGLDLEVRVGTTPSSLHK